MATINDLVEDWIQIRSTLQRHVKILESDERQALPEHAANVTVVRVRSWIADLNLVLKDHAAMPVPAHERHHQETSARGPN